MDDEQIEIALGIGHELERIRVTVEAMRVAYTNAYPLAGNGQSFQGNSMMLDSALFEALDRRRTELRHRLVEMG